MAEDIAKTPESSPSVPAHAPKQSLPLSLQGMLESLRSQPGPSVPMLIGIAAVVAVLSAAALWFATTSYDVLYRGLSDADAGEVLEALRAAGIPHRIDESSGQLLVPSDRVHFARMKLASQGLPKGKEAGFEILDGKDSFGVSQFLENARYQRALQGELSRTVAAIDTVKSARVHLALPKESVFVRRRQPPSASVFVELYSGRVLGKGQVRAIVHMVASSIPKLTADQVSVIDQTGNLLTDVRGTDELGLTIDQLEYTRQLEQHYISRVEDIVTPILGLGRVKAQVSVDVDFTSTEETAEEYNPKVTGGMLRSERTVDDMNNRFAPIGVPGALSNQPPGETIVPEQVGGGQIVEEGTGVDSRRPFHTRAERTKNYELDKRISHTRNAPGTVRRLSVAVVLDDRVATDEAGNSVRTPLTEQELTQIAALVKEAVGFDESRGDTANVVNASFAQSPFEVDQSNIWEQPWFAELVRLGLITILTLVIFFALLRPLMRRFAPESKPAEEIVQALEDQRGESAGALPGAMGMPDVMDDRVELSATDSQPGSAEEVAQLDARLRTAKALVSEDPKRSVQVIRNWIESEG